MLYLNKRIWVLGLATLLGLSACKSPFVIQDVNFAQPVESVLSPDENREVTDQRYAVSFNISGLLEKEEVESVDALHVIRDRAGYYFITAPQFGHVYVFSASEGELKSETEIPIPGDRLHAPAFNQRGDYIELIDLETDNRHRLNRDGLTEEEDL